MTITFELTIDQERKLREGKERQDPSAIRQILLQALDSMVEKLLGQAQAEPHEVDYEALADQLASSFAATAHADHRPLSEHAMTRQGIYGDHP